jgi:NAD(P)-dependent dehydrogenase (short-subunit alcohol dehydrogenase family)
LSLARKGVDVILTHRSRPDDARSAVREIEKLGRKAVALQLDTGRVGFPAFVDEIRGALRKTWDRDRFDFLVNNAGIGVYASFAETSEAQFDELMNIQLKGVLFLTQKLLPLIADAWPGRPPRRHRRCHRPRCSPRTTAG